MNFLKNKSVAFLFLFICIGVAIFIGSPYSMSKKHSHIEMSFYAERGIYQHIKKKVEYARDVITIASDYISIDDLTLVNLRKNIEDFSNSDSSIDSISTINSNLTNYVADVVLETKRIANITENDAKNLDRFLANTKERDTMIEKQDLYNLNSQKFNNAIDSFPGNVISTLADVKPLPLF